MLKVSTVIVLAILTLGGAAMARAAEESDWQDLEGDQSRQQLFAKLENLPDEQQTGPQSFPFKGYFHFPLDAEIDDLLEGSPPRQNEIFGIDISHYTDSTLNVRTLRQQGVSFVYVKATQGTKFKDKKFGTFWAALGELTGERKVFRGAYHFLTAGEDGTAQADRFVDYLDLHGGIDASDMAPCVDLEWDVTKTNPDRWKGQDPDAILDKLVAFLERVEQRTGRRPIIYTARSWWHDITSGQPAKRAHFNRLDGYTIWIADYSKSNRAKETPFVPLDRQWKIWQFTATSTLASGYPDDGFLDANVYKGTPDSFKADFGIVE